MLKQSKNTSVKTITQLNKENPFRNADLFILTGILVLTIAVFGTISKNAFFWDDYDYIINNPQVSNLSLSSIYAFFTSFYNGNYHPLTTFSWAVEYHFFGLHPIGYHNTSIVIHLINIILVFYFVRLLTKDGRVAIFTAILFAIHPMHVESVAWISERKDLLYTLFYIVSLLFYLKYLEKRNWKFLIAVYTFFILSCLSKSAAITLPLILILLDYYKDTLSIKSVLQKIPFLAISIIFGVVAIVSQKAGNAINDDVLHFGFFDRLLLMGYSIYYYFVSFFVPSNLCALHFYPKSAIPLSFQYYVVSGIVVLLLISLFFIKKYKKELIFGFGFYLLTISLVIQIIPLGKSLVSERYSYVPFIGLSIMLANIFLNELALRKNAKRNLSIASVLFAVCVVVLSLESYNRCTVWVSEYALFSDVIEKNPNEGYAYWLRCYNRLQDTDYAGCIADCDKGIKADSSFTVLYANRAVARYYLADYSGAILDYTKVLEREPNNAQVYYNRAKAKNEFQDYSSAVQDFEIAFKHKDFVKNANHFVELAVAKLLSNDAAGALIDLNSALMMNPQLVDAYFSKGNCYYQLKDYKNAILNYTKTVQLDPQNHNAYCNRGVSKSMLGDFDGACADFKISSELGNHDASNNYAHCK